MPSTRLLALVALAVVAALAGCGGPAASLEMSDLSDAEMADRASIDATDLQGEDRSLVVDAVENRTATATGQSPPFDPSLPVTTDGRYYNLSYAETDSQQATRYDIEVTAEPNATGEVVAETDLPAVDRQALRGAFARLSSGSETEGTIGVSTLYTDEEVEASRLVPEPDAEYVTHDGERYRVEVTGSRPDTIVTYRYTATEIAGSDAAFAESLRERYAFTLSGLSDGEREIIEQAAGSEYQNDDEVTPAFRSLVERFRAERGVTEDEFDDGDYYGGQYLVEYDGTVYWTQVRLRDPVSETP